MTPQFVFEIGAFAADHPPGTHLYGKIEILPPVNHEITAEEITIAGKLPGIGKKSGNPLLRFLIRHVKLPEHRAADTGGFFRLCRPDDLPPAGVEVEEIAKDHPAHAVFEIIEEQPPLFQRKCKTSSLHHAGPKCAGHQKCQSVIAELHLCIMLMKAEIRLKTFVFRFGESDLLQNDCPPLLHHLRVTIDHSFQEMNRRQMKSILCRHADFRPVEDRTELTERLSRKCIAHREDCLRRHQRNPDRLIPPVVIDIPFFRPILDTADHRIAQPWIAPQPG